MTPMHEHLRSRWLDLPLYSNIFVNDPVSAFPLYNLSGQCCGYMMYNPSQPKKEVGDMLRQKYFSGQLNLAAVEIQSLLFGVSRLLIG